MDDVISRKAAIEVAESHRVERPGFHLNDYEFGVTEAADAIASDLEDLPLAQQWIPCSERLPFAEYGEGNKVLTTCAHRNAEDGEYKWVRFLYFNGGVWCYPTGETYDQKVIAWMPLPEPAKLENE